MVRHFGRRSNRYLAPLGILTVAAAAVVLLLVALAPRVLDDDPSTAEPPATSETDCIPTGKVDTVAAINKFIATVRSGSAFAGGDVGASVLLQDDRRLFVFGDTLRPATFDGQKFVRNSMLVFSPGCGRAVLPADHGAVIPDRADGVGYWPMAIAKEKRDGYDLVGISAQRIHAKGKGIFDFDILGPSAVVFKVPVGGTPVLEQVVDIGPDRADTTQPMWGAAAATQGNWVYLYGTARPQKAGTFGFSLRVARIHPDDLLTPSKLTYWDGRTWTSNKTKAAELIASNGGVSQTLSVFKRGTTWYVLSKKDEVFGTDLAIWTGPTPQGPFTLASTLAKIPSDAVTGTLRYMPLAHPDLLPKAGTIVVSYSENNTNFKAVQNDPRQYRPRFLRIPLPE